MNKVFRIVLALVLGVAVASCATDETLEQVGKVNSLNNETMAAHLLNLLADDAAQQVVIGALEEARGPVTVEAALADLAAAGIENAATEGLAAAVAASDKALANGQMPDVVEIPEIWAQLPAGGFGGELHVMAVPAGEEMKKVTVYSVEGGSKVIGAVERPAFPVIAIEAQGTFAFRQEVKFMNQLLRQAGLQTAAHEKTLARANASAAGVETTKLSRVRLNDDQEPWTKGRAEIYAVTSGVRNSNKDAEIAIVDMPYLDYAGDTYYPNQIVLFWDDYYYAAANIQFWEKDSGYNYKDLVAILVSGVGQIAGIISAQPWIPAVTEIANQIIQVMPDDWYTDDDDYVDTYYTIEKNRTYTNYPGAGNNANVNLTPYFLPVQ